MQLVLAPPPTFGPDNSPVIAIWPDFDENQPIITSCGSGPCVRLPAQPANFVYLRSAPSSSASLIADPDLSPGAAAGTTNAADWGDKAVAGQEFVVAGR